LKPRLDGELLQTRHRASRPRSTSDTWCTRSRRCAATRIHQRHRYHRAVGSGPGDAGHSAGQKTLRVRTIPDRSRQRGGHVRPHIHHIDHDRIVLDAGATWRDVLTVALPQGLTPPVLPEYLDLSVGGTIAAGGTAAPAGATAPSATTCSHSRSPRATDASSTALTRAGSGSARH
jgi:FAD/FMN-containing dehydrogenase